MSDAAHDSSPPGQFYCPTCEKTFAQGEVCPNDNTRLVRLRVTDPLIGRVLDGRYTIQQKLGQGGMGAVYRGSQHSVGREVAIKLVTPTLVSDHDVIKRFLREAKLASRLSHPNAVAVMDFGQTDDGLFYLVMELVTGRTLDQVIKAEKKLKPERVIRIGMQVCDALDGAHALQIVHRDLKPANIMLMTQGRDLVKVLDFGLAKSLAPDQTSTTMTNAGSLLGTPAFMPPELALGQPCDGRADLYSLGCVLYLLGSGRLPFVSESAHELIAMHGVQPAPPMEGVPQQLADVVDRLLQKNPADRFQSAADVREALEAALDATRTNTPVAGMPRVRIDTPSGMVAAEKTPVPGPTSSPHISGTQSNRPMQTLLQTPSASASRPRLSTEMEQLGNSDTILPTAMAAPSIAPARPAKSSRAPLVVGLAALLVVGVAVAMFAMKGKSSSPSTAPPATQETATPESTTAPKQPEQPTQAAVKQPEQPPAQPVQPPAQPEQSPAVTNVVPEVTKVVPEVTKVIPEVTVKPDKHTTKTTKTTKTTDTTKTTKTTKTTETTKPDTTKTGTGSAGPAQLPF